MFKIIAAILVIISLIGWATYPNHFDSYETKEVKVLEKYGQLDVTKRNLHTDFIIVYSVDSSNLIHSTKVSPATFYVAKIGEKINLQVPIAKNNWEIFFRINDLILIMGLLAYGITIFFELLVSY